MNPADALTFSKVNDDIALYQNPKGLMFGTDALLLAAFVRSNPKNAAAEFGAGTGIVSLLVAKRNKFRTVTSVEVQEEYASLAEKNVHYNGLQEKITVVCSDIRTFRGEYDVIFSNPPYMKITSGFRNTDNGKFIARHEVTGNVTDFCNSAARCLKFGGIFYCVYRPDRLCDLLFSMRTAALEPKRIAFVHRSTAYPPSLVLVEAKKNAESGIKLLRPLFLTDENGKDTEDMTLILREGNFYDG